MPSLGLCIQPGATLIFEDTSRIHVNVFWYSVLCLLPFLFRISDSFLDSPFFLFPYPVIPLMYLTQTHCTWTVPDVPNLFHFLCAVLSHQSCLTCDPMTVACHAPPSMGFSRQGYWSGLPFPAPGDLSDLGIKP